MKKLMLAAASLAMIAAPVAASAQSYGHGRDGGSWSNRGGDRDGGSWSNRGGDRDGGSWSNRGGDRDGRGFQRGDYRRGYDGDRGDGGAAIAAGLFGFIVGSAIASSSHSYGHDNPYRYGQSCGWRNQAYDDGYGGVQYRQVQVCR